MRLLTCNSCGKSVEYKRRGKAPKIFYCGDCSERPELVLHVDQKDLPNKSARVLSCAQCSSTVEWKKRGRKPKIYICASCRTNSTQSISPAGTPPKANRLQELSEGRNSAIAKKVKVRVFRKDLPIEVGDVVLFVPWGLYPESVLPERAKQVTVVEISEDRRIAKVSLPQYNEPQTTRLSNLCHFEEVEVSREETAPNPVEEGEEVVNGAGVV